MKGDDIVKAFMAEHKICPRDFFESRFGEHVELRAKAIKRLRAAGLNMTATAQAMHRAPETIRYWLTAGRRRSELDRRKAHHASKKKIPTGKYRKLALALEELYRHDNAV